jgi:signal transduction histidine kinase
VQWPAAPASIPAYDTAALVLASITAWLLYAQYRQSGGRALLALFCGYSFTPVVVAAHALSFPDAFVPGTLVGDEQTTAWLRMGWHGVFPLVVTVYALLARDDVARPQTPRGRETYALAALLVSLTLALAVVAVTMIAPPVLPPLMSGGRYLPATQLVLVAGCIADLVALGLLFLATRARRVLDLWLAVAVVAMLIDLALSAVFVTGRFQADFYLGRIYGLLGIAFVLFALLRESVAASGQAAAAMTRVQESEERVMADLRGTRLLRDLGARLVAEGDDSTFHEEIARAARALTGAAAATVEILEPCSDTPRLIGAAGVDAGMTERHRSAQSTPLVSRSGRVIGMISIHSADSRCLDEREQCYLDLLARQAADLIEHRQSEAALRRAHAELEASVEDRTSALAAEVSERRAAESRSKALLGRVMSVQEEERKRIARDIHDQMGQQITALRMSLEAVRAAAPPDARLVAAAERAARVAEELDRSIDSLTRELRPVALDHLGLTAAIENLVRGWSARFGVPVEFRNAVGNRLRLSADAEAHLYHIAQEALHNIYKHAKASLVRVTLAQADGHLQLAIEDDGRGFSPVDVHETSTGGLGLESMRERASLIGGQLVVRSACGRGTTITVRVPAAAESM